MEDGIDYSVHALHVSQSKPSVGFSPHFDKTAFDNVGGPQLLPEMLGEAKK
jgi:hypothetical protein